MSLFYRIASQLPFSLPWKAAQWYANHKRENATLDFLWQIFSQYFPDASESQRREWAHRHMELLSIELMDTYAMHRVGQKNGVALWVQGDELLQEAQRTATGVILVLNHYDRILTGAIALAKKGFVINSLRIDLEKDASVPDTLRQFLRTKTQKFEQIVGGISLGRRQSMRRLYKGLERGEIWCILADAWDEGATEKRPYPFLGKTIYLSHGLERIALRTGARLIHMASYTTAAHLVNVRLTPLPDPATAMHQAIAVLERDVAEHPWAWWNWGVLNTLQEPPIARN